MKYRLCLAAFVAACAAVAMLPFIGSAIELRYDAGVADDYTFQLTDGYLVRFYPPQFVEPVITDVSFYGNRFGIISTSKPPDGYVAILDKDFNKLSGRSVPFSDISQDPAWNHIKMDPLVVKDMFWVYVLLPSGPTGGVMMGKDVDPDKLVSRTGNHAAGFRQLTDGKYNWMMRVEVADGHESKSEFSSSDLSGAKFLKKDSGVSEGLTTLFKDGATVAFDLAEPAVIDKIYIYGRMTGDWYTSDREFTLYLLDSDLRIQMTRNFPYRLFRSKPGWLRIDVPDTKFAGSLFVIIEPNSREEAALELGYDQNPNQGSSVTAMGQPVDWPFKFPVDTFNWMVRLEKK